MLHVGLARLESQRLVHQRAERTLVVDSRRQVTASQLMNFCAQIQVNKGLLTLDFSKLAQCFPLLNTQTRPGIRPIIFFVSFSP
jgi:hypothetical protein